MFVLWLPIWLSPDNSQKFVNILTQIQALNDLKLQLCWPLWLWHEQEGVQLEPEKIVKYYFFLKKIYFFFVNFTRNFKFSKYFTSALLILSNVSKVLVSVLSKIVVRYCSWAIRTNSDWLEAVDSTSENLAAWPFLTWKINVGSIRFNQSTFLKNLSKIKWLMSILCKCKSDFCMLWCKVEKI